MGQFTTAATSLATGRPAAVRVDDPYGKLRVNTSAVIEFDQSPF